MVRSSLRRGKEAGFSLDRVVSDEGLLTVAYLNDDIYILTNSTIHHSPLPSVPDTAGSAVPRGRFLNSALPRLLGHLEPTTGAVRRNLPIVYRVVCGS